MKHNIMLKKLFLNTRQTFERRIQVRLWEKLKLYLEDETTVEIGRRVLKLPPIPQNLSIPNIPRIAPDGLIHNYLVPERETKVDLVIPINFNPITRKRFIKLVMSRGYQRNEAKKMHEEYMLELRQRTRFGIEIFLMFRGTHDFKILVGGRDYGKGYSTNVMGKFNMMRESEDKL